MNSPLGRADLDDDLLGVGLGDGSPKCRGAASRAVRASLRRAMSSAAISTMRRASVRPSTKETMMRSPEHDVGDLGGFRLVEIALAGRNLYDLSLSGPTLRSTGWPLSG